MLIKKRKLKRLFSGEDQGNLKIYIDEINQFKILGKKEEQELAKKMAAGNLEARNQLILCNLRFVISIAKRYINKGVPFLDLINEGNMGLILACDKFDYKKGYRFISYAVWWIKQYITKSFAEQLGLIRLPMNKALQYFKIRLLMEGKLKDKLNHSILDENIEKNMYLQIEKDFSLKEKDIHAIMNAMFKYKSLNEPMQRNDRKSIFFEDLLIDTKNKLPEVEMVEKDTKEEIHQYLSFLSKKEREIISYRYGLKSYQILSLGKIGTIFNVSKERIRQIEKIAIKKLYVMMKESERNKKNENFIKTLD